MSRPAGSQARFTARSAFAYFEGPFGSLGLSFNKVWGFIDEGQIHPRIPRGSGLRVRYSLGILAGPACRPRPSGFFSAVAWSKAAHGLR